MGFSKFNLKARVDQGRGLPPSWSSSASFDASVLGDPPALVKTILGKLAASRSSSALAGPELQLRAAYVLAAEQSGPWRSRTLPIPRPTSLSLPPPTHHRVTAVAGVDTAAATTKKIVELTSRPQNAPYQALQPWRDIVNASLLSVIRESLEAGTQRPIPHVPHAPPCPAHSPSPSPLPPVPPHADSAHAPHRQYPPAFRAPPAPPHPTRPPRTLGPAPAPFPPSPARPARSPHCHRPPQRVGAPKVAAAAHARARSHAPSRPATAGSEQGEGVGCDIPPSKRRRGLLRWMARLGSSLGRLHQLGLGLSIVHAVDDYVESDASSECTTVDDSGEVECTNGGEAADEGDAAHEVDVSDLAHYNAQRVVYFDAEHVPKGVSGVAAATVEGVQVFAVEVTALSPAGSGEGAKPLSQTRGDDFEAFYPFCQRKYGIASYGVPDRLKDPNKIAELSTAYEEVAGCDLLREYHRKARFALAGPVGLYRDRELSYVATKVEGVMRALTQEELASGQIPTRYMSSFPFYDFHAGGFLGCVPKVCANLSHLPLPCYLKGRTYHPSGCAGVCR